MYAIVEDSGTQIKVSTGDVLEVDLRDVEGDTITLDNVLMIGGEGEPTLGTPYVEGATVATMGKTTAQRFTFYTERKIITPKLSTTDDLCKAIYNHITQLEYERTE